MSLKTFIQTGQRFFFLPQSPVPVALFRIFMGLCLLQLAVVHLGPDFLLYYGDKGIYPIASVAAHWWQKDFAFDLLLLLPPGDQWKMVFYWVYVVAILNMVFGLFTRASCVVVYVCLLSLQHHFPFNTNGGDNYLRLVTFLLCFSQADKALSLDRLWQALREDWRITGFKPANYAPWAQRMLQLQLALAYAGTFLCKAAGAKWVNGTAVYYATRLQDYLKLPLPPPLSSPIGTRLLSWYTLFIEGALCTLVWFKKCRYWVLLGGIILHLGIDWSFNLPVFEWAFMSSYILWVDPEDLSHVMDRIKEIVREKYGPSLALAYDGNCLFCIRTVGILHRLDIFGRLDLLDFRKIETINKLPDLDLARAEEEMLLKTRNGWLGGFDAFREMTKSLPLAWPLLPLLWIPGIDYLGRKVYAWIAAHRYLILGGHCTSGFCLTD